MKEKVIKSILLGLLIYAAVMIVAMLFAKYIPFVFLIPSPCLIPAMVVPSLTLCLSLTPLIGWGAIQRGKRGKLIILLPEGFLLAVGILTCIMYLNNLPQINDAIIIADLVLSVLHPVVCGTLTLWWIHEKEVY